MRVIVAIILVVAAYFCLTAFAPTTAGNAWIGWPFAADSKPWLAIAGGLPSQSGLLTTALAGVAGLCFISALLSLLDVVVPLNWWPLLVTVAAITSLLLHILYFSVLSLIPIGIDMVLLWIVFMEYRSVEAIVGS